MYLPLYKVEDTTFYIQREEFIIYLVYSLIHIFIVLRNCTLLIQLIFSIVYLYVNNTFILWLYIILDKHFN